MQAADQFKSVHAISLLTAPNAAVAAAPDDTDHHSVGLAKKRRSKIYCWQDNRADISCLDWDWSAVRWVQPADWNLNQCTTAFVAHHHLVHTSIWCTTAFGAHQHLVHTSIWCTTAFAAQQRLVHNSILCTQTFGAHQHLVHTSIWCTLAFGAHYHLVHTTWLLTAPNAAAWVQSPKSCLRYL